MLRKKPLTKSNTEVAKTPTKPASSDIMSRIRPVASSEVVLTSVIYGRSGTGKTTLAGTFPTPHLVLDIREDGTDSVADVKGMFTLRINSWNDIEEIYWLLKNQKVSYKTVTIDAVHSMQDLALREAQKDAGKSEDDQTSKRDFGIAAGMMKTWIYNFRDLAELGINVNFLVHDRLRSTDDDGEDGQIMPEIGPNVMPSVASPLVGAVKLVAHTFIREERTKPKKLGEKSERRVEYCVRVGPHSQYMTKIRSPRESFVPDFIVDPTYQKLVNVMRGLVTKPVPKAPPAAVRRVVKK